MNKVTLAIIAALSASIALADDFKTIDGREYKNVTVSRVEPDGIVITFSGGIVKIPFTELSPEASDSEFFAAKLAKLRAERAKIDLENQITRSERIPIEDAVAATSLVFGAISGILKANRNKMLTEAQINEIFDQMRTTARQLQHDYGNGCPSSAT